ncbi:hypothetical protein [Erwinia phage FBB1]|nr:hypothetical protein [Erwinia phage FBB1]
MYNPNHTPTLSEFKINYKKFIDSVWDGHIRTYKVTSMNQYDAVADLAKIARFQETEHVDVEIVSVSNYAAKNFNHGALYLNRIYTTLNGTKVIMKGISDAGTEHETMFDQFGIHRYSRRPGCIGRCTGSSVVDPMNIKLGTAWYSNDFDKEEYEKANDGFVVCRSEHQVHNHQNIDGKLNHVSMDYRGYTIYGQDDVWHFIKNPHTYLGIIKAVHCKDQFDAREQIDKLEGDD